MSGPLSLFREIMIIYRPDQAQPRSLFWSCILIAFIISSAILLIKQHKKINILAKGLDEEKDRKKPNLSSEFDVFAVAPAGKKEEDSVITIMAIIRNVGAPSIISNVRVVIKKENMEIQGEDVVLGQGPMFLEGEGLKLIVKEEDNLPRKGIANPIPTGGALHGWHIVLARKIKKEEIYNRGTIITFSYKDVTGRLYATEKKMDKPVSKLIDATKLQNK